MQHVTVNFPSGKHMTVPYGTKVSDIIESSEFKALPYPLVGVKLNNDLSSLSAKIEVNSAIKPVTLDTAEGAMIYRRSLCFLLAIASEHLFPERRLVVGHSLGESFFYYYEGLSEVDQADLAALTNEMKRLVESNLPISKRVISYTEALEHFRKENMPDTASLLEYRNDARISTYTCGDYLDLSHGPLVPATGLLCCFELSKYHSGFLLKYPPTGSPYALKPFEDKPILFSVFQEYKNWGKILGVHCVGKLNELSKSPDKLKDFIRVAEALHNKKISEIADRIFARVHEVRVILIAGPSSSGKTTFAKKLSVQLKVLGIEPIAISLDDYFVSREKTPRDAFGNYDFEALEAIDVPLLNEHLVSLFEGKEVMLPLFDFKTGERKFRDKPLKLPERSMLILEGIHGLNDRLTPLIRREQKYKVYVSALTQLNLDDHSRIPTTDNRLIRRMVRDNRYRGHDAVRTLSMWDSVRRGEDGNIFPFQNTADSAFNSALDYELAVLKTYAEPLLKTVKPFHEEYSEAVRLLSFLNNFMPIPSVFVPTQSILREFIGDSEFKY